MSRDVKYLKGKYFHCLKYNKTSIVVYMNTCIWKCFKTQNTFVQLILSKWQDVLHFCMLVTALLEMGSFDPSRNGTLYVIIRYRITTPIHGAECNSCICLMSIQCFASRLSVYPLTLTCNFFIFKILVNLFH